MRVTDAELQGWMEGIDTHLRHVAAVTDNHEVRAHLTAIEERVRWLVREKFRQFGTPTHLAHLPVSYEIEVLVTVPVYGTLKTG